MYINPQITTRNFYIKLIYTQTPSFSKNRLGLGFLASKDYNIGMKNVLITGGAGFIGFTLAKKLISERYNVTTFDNFSNQSKNYSGDYLSTIQGDITNRDDVTNCVRTTKPDIIVHLAAQHYIPFCIENPITTKKINVTGTKNILEAIKEFSRKTYFIFTSSASVYAPKDKAHQETSEIGPLDVYGKSKVEAENITKTYANFYDIEYTILRLFNVYGFGDSTPHLIPTIIKQVKNGSVIKLGNLAAKRDYIYLDDVVNGFMSAIKNIEVGKNQTFNLGSGKAYSAIEIVDDIGNNIQKRLIIKVENKRIRKNDRPILFADISKTNKYLGWKPRYNLHEGLTLLLKREGLI